MEDSNPVLLNGNGTPYLAIFNGSGKPIMDLKNNIPIGMEVEDFEYKYTEGKGDKGKFTIQTDWVDIVDVPDLQFKMPIRLQWGWIFSDGSYKFSPLRTLNIKSHSIEFNSEGVKLSIELADAKMFLETSPSVFVANNHEYLDVFNQLAEGRFPFRVVDYKEDHLTKYYVAKRK